MSFCSHTYRGLGVGSVPGSERSPGEGTGNPLQYSCLENPMDGGAWWAAVHGVAKSWTQLSDFTFTFHFHASRLNFYQNVRNDWILSNYIAPFMLLWVGRQLIFSTILTVKAYKVTEVREGRNSLHASM